MKKSQFVFNIINTLRLSCFNLILKCFIKPEYIFMNTWLYLCLFLGREMFFGFTNIAVCLSFTHRTSLWSFILLHTLPLAITYWEGSKAFHRTYLAYFKLFNFYFSMCPHWWICMRHLSIFKCYRQRICMRYLSIFKCHLQRICMMDMSFFKWHH